MISNESIKDRLKTFIKHKGISIRAFEAKCGFSYGFVGNMRNSMQPDKVMKIAHQFPELNTGWLMTGEGDMLREERVTESGAVLNFTDGVPYYDEDFLLGFEEVEAPSSINPTCLVRVPGYERATMWCNASGHSMEPEICNGDLIALQRIDDFSFLPYGEIYGIITTNGLRTIKRLGHSTREGCYRLIPTNKADCDEQDIPISKIYMVYRVLGTMKSF